MKKILGRKYKSTSILLQVKRKVCTPGTVLYYVTTGNQRKKDSSHDLVEQ